MRVVHQYLQWLSAVMPFIYQCLVMLVTCFRPAHPVRSRQCLYFSLSAQLVLACSGMSKGTRKQLLSRATRQLGGGVPLFSLLVVAGGWVATGALR